MSLFSKKSKGEPPRREDPPQRPGGKPNGAASPSAADTARASAAAPQISAQDLENGLAKSRRTLISLGEIVSVLMGSPQYRSATLASIEALVAPAISTGQFLVTSAHNKARGITAPVSIALWARVSADVDRRLSEQTDVPVQLKAQEWVSGDIPWLLALAGDQRTFGAMLTRLQQSQLKGRPLKARLKGPDGKTLVQTLTPTSGQPEQVAF